MAGSNGVLLTKISRLDHQSTEHLRVIDQLLRNHVYYLTFNLHFTANTH